MPDKENKSRNKVLESWAEIKDLSKYIEPGDPVTTPSRENSRDAVLGRKYREIEKTAIREEDRRAAAESARAYENRVLAAPLQEGDYAAIGRSYRSIEKTAPREHMRRAGRRKAQEYEKLVSEMTMERSRKLVNMTRQRREEQRKAKDD